MCTLRDVVRKTHCVSRTWRCGPDTATEVDFPTNSQVYGYNVMSFALQVMVEKKHGGIPGNIHASVT